METNPNPMINEQMKALGVLYREMHASVKQEVATAKAIFPRPDMVGCGVVAIVCVCG